LTRRNGFDIALNAINKKLTKKTMNKLDTVKSLSQDKDYINFFKQVQKRLQTAQIKAALAANVEQIRFYWELGVDIADQQSSKQWGSHFLDQLSQDMQRAFPGMKGSSKRNLEHMRRFALTYPDLDFAKQPVSQLPWGHTIEAIESELNSSPELM
jgi:predicted nuclease of restriction endonuclease-like (RecB) superfamily